MKICIIQPAYSTDFSKVDDYFNEQIKLIDQCDESMDLIVLPESCDIPCLAESKENGILAYKKFNQALLNKVSETAKRCHDMVFVNALNGRKSQKGRRLASFALYKGYEKDIF